MNYWLTLASFIIGILVGLTGMGGGALMTPVLVVLFGINPLSAVSSDLVASAVMKPIGSLVHLRHGTVDFRLVGWLALGSVPSAFCGVLIIEALGGSSAVETVVQIALGAALVLAALTITLKAYLQLLERTRGRGKETAQAEQPTAGIRIRPVPTVLIGVVGGLVVGMTSVGSGSVMIVSLLFLYPALTAGRLVGTDLTQAVPLVASAAVGHLIFGDVQFGVTLPLLIGNIPGVYLGARLSARAPQGVIRRALAVVLLASGAKLLGAGNLVLLLVVVAALVFGLPGWMLLRRAYYRSARSAEKERTPVG